MAQISVVIPTMNRHAELHFTLNHLQKNASMLLGAQPNENQLDILVIDNASELSVTSQLPKNLASMHGLRVIRLDENLSAAARNIGAEHAHGDWIMMLDDDSVPIKGMFNAFLSSLPSDVYAVGGEIWLPNQTHEQGGMPEVVVGCGCLYRKDAFLNTGGYDPTFEYYVEEYDLCARLIQMGGRVVHTRSLQFVHRKVQHNRDFRSILRRIVRNNIWVLDRYCPEELRDQATSSMLSRYKEIAHLNEMCDSYAQGVQQARNADAKHSSPLSNEHWNRFIGKQAIKDSLVEELVDRGIQEVRMVNHGKGSETLEETLCDSGVTISDQAKCEVISTLSPGPMIDAHAEDPSRLCGWSFFS